MKYLLLSLNFLIVYATSYGQMAIQQSSLAPGGTTTIRGNQQLLYTIGESFISEKQVNDLHLSEGFINQLILNSLGVESSNKLNGITVFPVPVHNQLSIRMLAGDYEIFLYDMTGKDIINQSIENYSKIKLDMTAVKPGNYLLVIIQLPKKGYYIQKIVKL